MKTIKLLIIPSILTIILGFIVYDDMVSHYSKAPNPKHIIKDIAKIPMLPLDNIIIKDTVFVLSNTFMVISLKEQICYLYQRYNNEPMIYKISSGNPFISQGIETSIGLFTVQSKNPLGISKQFNNAELHNWIGFNVNIGLHGLKTNSYYNSLGVRPSSHGCVRIGREDGADLYKQVKLGTPILVYKDEPALTLAFAPKKNIEMTNYEPIPSDSRKYRKTINNRLNNLYRGLAYVNNKTKLMLDGTTIIKRGGYPIGIHDSIPYKQVIPLPKKWETTVSKIDMSSVNVNYKAMTESNQEWAKSSNKQPNG